MVPPQGTNGAYLERRYDAKVTGSGTLNFYFLIKLIRTFLTSSNISVSDRCLAWQLVLYYTFLSKLRFGDKRQPGVINVLLHYRLCCWQRTPQTV